MSSARSLGQSIKFAGPTSASNWQPDPCVTSELDIHSPEDSGLLFDFL
jgi:hypothetical protein